MWTCPKCQAKVDPTFEVCWQCGTTADGVEDPGFVRADDEGPIDGPSVLEEARVFGSPEETPIGAVAFGPDVELVEAYRAEDRMQAHFLAGELTAIGIPAMADSHEPNESLGGMLALPKVWVRAEDFSRAKSWLDAQETIHRADHPSEEA